MTRRTKCRMADHVWRIHESGIWFFVACTQCGFHLSSSTMLVAHLKRHGGRVYP